MKSLRKTTKDEFENLLIARNIGLTEHQAHVISGMMSEHVVEYVKNNHTSLSNIMAELNKEYEQTRNHYREHVLNLQSGTKKVMESLTHQGMVFFETNPKNKRRELKCRTNVLKAVVDFMNSIDNDVLDFFDKVYKIEEDGKVQTSLFPQEINNLDKKS